MFGGRVNILLAPLLWHIAGGGIDGVNYA